MINTVVTNQHGARFAVIGFEWSGDNAVVLLEDMAGSEVGVPFRLFTKHFARVTE